jgi:hypothetical protein
LFGPNKLDKTFGPTAVFEKAPTVDLIDLDGVSQFQKVLNREGA